MSQKPRRAEFDWQGARDRLERATSRLEQMKPAERERILAERAQALARKPAAVASGSAAVRAEHLELLRFTWARERYAIGTEFVQQVIKPCELTRLPGAPAHLRGVTNLRGEILPVFDLRDWFEVERVSRDEGTRWLVLGAEASELCLWVDGVEDVTFVEPQELHRSDREDRGNRDLVAGVTRDARTVLDGAQLLAHPELFIGETPGARQEVVS